MKHIGLFIKDISAKSKKNDLEALTINQLRELAAENGIDLGSAKTKAEIIAKLKKETE